MRRTKARRLYHYATLLARQENQKYIKVQGEVRWVPTCPRGIYRRLKKGGITSAVYLKLALALVHEEIGEKGLKRRSPAVPVA